MDRNKALRSSNINQKTIIQTASRLLEERRLRGEHLPLSDLLGEPAWDVLLFIFVSQAKGKGAKVEGLAFASRIPVAHALRWLERLESREMVFAYRDEENDGEVFLRLTSKGHSAMSQYLHQIALREMG